jgi:MFS family permease
MLAMGVLLVVGGRLGDKFGQRRLFLIGIGGFTLASAVAGFSPDPALLIAARVAQGAFGALLIPQGMAIMTKAFSRDMLAKAFGLFGPVLGLSSVGGPVLAGPGRSLVGQGRCACSRGLRRFESRDRDESACL